MARSGESELGDNLHHLLEVVTHRLRATHERRLESTGVTLSQYGVLTTLAHGEAQGPGELSTRLDVDATATSRLIDRLESKGLVERRPHPGDGRRRVLHLTDEGRRLVPVLAERVRETNIGALEDLGVEGAAALKGALRRLAQDSDRETLDGTA